MRATVQRVGGYNLKRTWPLPINRLAQVCGYFTSRHATNNGYGCSNAKNESKEFGNAVAPCLASSCPVANELSADEPSDVAVMEAAGYNPASLEGGEWVVPFVGTRAAREAKAESLRQ